MDALQIHIDEHPTGPVIRLKGEATVGAEKPLEIAMTRLCAQRPKLAVLDLSELSLISSLVFGQLIAAQRAVVRAGGRFCLVAVQPRIMDAFRRSGLDAVFQFFGTVGEAQAS